MTRPTTLRADQIQAKPPPRCPTCGEFMQHYGGSAGYIHCGWKLLYRAGGWFDDNGHHVQDERLEGGRDLSLVRWRAT